MSLPQEMHLTISEPTTKRHLLIKTKYKKYMASLICFVLVHWNWNILLIYLFRHLFMIKFNPLSANITKWSNTFKQFVGKLPTNCLSVFDHFVGLTFKGLSCKESCENQNSFYSLPFGRKFFHFLVGSMVGRG